MAAADPSPATEQLAYLNASDAAALLDTGEVTSAELVEAALRRIEEIDAPASPIGLRSVLAVADRALDQARDSDRRRAGGEKRGPLEGIPVVVKDNVEALGLPSCAGSTGLLGRPPVRDAPLVARLRVAGAVVIGSANLSEWANIRSARSTGGWSAVGGLTGNPWALDRNAGGSSSGSGAAVAAGIVALAVGTETDGSITCPASLNGVAGLKPAVGAVPTEGVVPISASQDSPGPLARTAADAALLFDVIAGRDAGRVLTAGGGARGLVVATASTWRTGHPPTDELFVRTVDKLRQAGAEVRDVEPPVPSEADHDDELTVLLCELKDGLDAYLPTRGPGGPQSLAEVVAHEDAQRAVEQEWFGHDLFEKALQLGGCDNERYRQARARNLAWALGCLEAALAGADVLVAPTYGPAWKSDLVLGGHPAAAAPTTMAPAVAGWPIATVPMGLAQGLPVGVALIGRPGSERRLLAAGATVEAPARPAWAPPTRG